MNHVTVELSWNIPESVYPSHNACPLSAGLYDAPLTSSPQSLHSIVNYVNPKAAVRHPQIGVTSDL